MTIKVVVPISGGKDSQACLKLAAEHFEANEIRAVFCDTKYEHPWTYQHVTAIGKLYGDIQIDVVSGGSVLSAIDKYQRIPDFGTRFCTDELKIREMRIYLKALAQQLGHGFEVWYGMRFGESSARSKRYKGKVSSEIYQPHEVLPNKYPKYLGRMGVMFKLPVIEWSDEDIFDYLGMVNVNPLYLFGFDRVGCFPCLAGGDEAKKESVYV